MNKIKIFLVAMLFHTSLYGATSVWTSAVSGDWGDPGNWVPGVPNSIDAIAQFTLLSSSAPILVNLNQNITVGTIDFSEDGADPFGYQIVGANTLTLQVSSGSASIIGVDVLGVPRIFSVPIQLNSNTIFSSVSTNPGGGLIFDNVISGASTLSIQGAGGTQFTGSSANTYTGLTTVTSGSRLILNKSINVAAIAGDIVVNSGGLLTTENPHQFSSTTTLTLSGQFNTQNFNQTLGRLVLNTSSNLNSGTSAFTLASASNALTMQNVTLSAPIILSNGGSVAFDPANNGTATINSTVDLGGFTVNFDIGNGAAATDMQVSGVISNGGINKIGAGLLSLTGANTYALGTTITAGTLQGNTTSLPGNIVDNSNLVFNQTFDGSYSGSLTGTGTFFKTGSGVLTLEGNSVLPNTVTVVAGELEVNGSLTGGGPLTVNPGATLGGAGTIGKNSTIFGILAPGNEIGTLNFIGNQVLATGSRLEIEGNPSIHDLVNIQGTLTIQPGSTLFVAPIPGEFLVRTTAGVFGRFSLVTSSVPLFRPVVIYTQLDILLQAAFMPFSTVFHQGKAGAVAHCLDVLPSPDGSDLAFIIAELRAIPTLTELKDALLTLQPSAFVSLSQEQENNTLLISHVINDRLESQLLTCCVRPCGYSLWSAPLTSFTHQSSRKENPGYSANTPGLVVGIDYASNSEFCYGSHLAYTHSDLHWKMHRGNSQMDSLYGGLYAQWLGCSSYLQGSITGVYNWYHINRHIAFQTIDRHAKSRHHGVEGTGNLRGGLLVMCGATHFSPYLNFDYIYLHEHSYREHGAGSVNLHVKGKDASVLVSELGIDLSRCGCGAWDPFFEASVIHETRLKGGRVHASFEEGCDMSVRGYSPSRLLGGLTFGADFACLGSLYNMSIYYKGKMGKNMQTHSVYLEAVF